MAINFTGSNLFTVLLLFAAGLVFIIKGGDWFVDGATGLARRFHVPELLIGATVVSIGTTLPEVMVSTIRRCPATAKLPTATPSVRSSATRPSSRPSPSQ